MAMDEVMVSALNDLPEGDHKVFALPTIEVGIFRLGDQVLAYENVCPHAGGPAVRCSPCVRGRCWCRRQSSRSLLLP